MIQTGVTNPLPQAATIAIVPFFNQSSERAVDGRRIAEIYQEELQKIPGFKVVPVGRTEIELIQRGLSLKSPADALVLAEAMKVDMIVVGTITDYSAYYPPRIGMHVAWYSPKPLSFNPGVQVDPYARKHFKLTKEVKHQMADDFYPAETKGWNRLRKVGRVTGAAHFTRAFGSFRRGMWNYIKGEEVPAVYEEEVPLNPDLEIRSQSPDFPNDTVKANRPLAVPPIMEAPSVLHSSPSDTISGNPIDNKSLNTNQSTTNTAQVTPEYCPVKCDEDCDQKSECENHRHREHHLHFPNLKKYPGVITAEPLKPILEFDPLEPVMSYTKIFDARNSDVVANLRDYCELNNDLRSGGWKAYLERTDDYIRFTTHRMIVEMLTLHGGEGKRRIVLKKRKYR